MILRVYVDDRTLAILRDVSEQTGRSVEDLAEAAVAEAAIKTERDAVPKGASA